MKRLHVHVGVNDLDQSIRFYSTLFAARADRQEGRLREVDARRPARQFRDLGGRSMRRKASTPRRSGREHATSWPSLWPPRSGRRPVLEEGRTTCCYAKSDKSWIADPDGVVWETFFTDGEATTYGDSPALGTLGDSLSEDKCCLPKAAA